jgi:hypothetical protein
MSCSFQILAILKVLVRDEVNFRAIHVESERDA